MAYGSSADEELVRQFKRVCKFCGNQDKTQMTRIASKTLVKLFWRTNPNFAKVDLKSCERKVFEKLTKRNRKDYIRVDGPHVEAYLTEMAHEVTMVTREDPKIYSDHPCVTFCKAKMEEIVRGTVIQGYHIDPMTNNGNAADGQATEKTKTEPYPYKKPEPPKTMRKEYDLRKHMPIVIAKRDYGNYN